MRKLLLLIASTLLIFCCIVLAKQPDSILKSSGAHPGSTGAPGEQTCARSGCHENATISSGEGVNTFQLGNNTTAYTPGETYNVKIKAQRAGISRFGFEVVALDKNNNSIGTWKNTPEPTRTQIISAPVNGLSRLYVTHKSGGTPAISPGMNEWNFTWTAPANYSDSVKFYYVTNTTNNDNTEDGDALFLSSAAFAAKTPNSIDNNGDQKISLSLYPNPASNFIVLKNIGEKSLIEVFGADGKVMIPSQRISTGESRLGIEQLPSGKYYIRATSPNQQSKTLSFVKQ